MIVEMCLVISAMLGLYDCDYKIEYATAEEINEHWTSVGGKGMVTGAFYPSEKLIQVTSNYHLMHEYRHAFCYNYWMYHEHTNHEWCMTPHFKIQA